MTDRSDANSTPAVELREDIPLKSSGSFSVNWTLGRYFGGIRFIIICFGVLTTAITIALAAQIYYGHFELVPHGSVASDHVTCSRIGTDILKAGGNAVDAAIAATFCLAVVAPHLTGLDGGGVLMVYNYKEERDVGPSVVDFSGPRNITGLDTIKYPRLVTGLALIHRLFGKLSWPSLVGPAAYIASMDFNISPNLARAMRNYGASGIFGALRQGDQIKMSPLANYLKEIANTSTVELSENKTNITTNNATRTDLDVFEIFTPVGNSAGDQLLAVLQDVVKLNFTAASSEEDQVVFRIAEALKSRGGEITFNGTGTNVAVVSSGDIYVSLVTGMSEPFGNHQLTSQGYLEDFPVAPTLTLLPAIVTETNICGRRFILGSSEVSSLAQVIANLIIAAENLTVAIELPRVTVLTSNDLRIEGNHNPSFSKKSLEYLQTLGSLQNLTEPYASCNVIQQFKDDLTSHSDSRGGGIASRF